MTVAGIIVANPKGSDSNVLVTYELRNGSKKTKTVKPGGKVRVKKPNFSARVVPIPPHLLLQADGSCVPDTRRL